MSFIKKLIPNFNDIVTKEDFEINWDIPLISFSQIKMHNSCPHSWKLKYIDKIKLDKYNIHLLYGTALHQTVQMYLHYIFNVSVSEANALDLSSILKEYMIEIYEENQKNENNNMDITYDDMVEYYDAGVKCLEWLRTNRTKYFSTKKYKLIGIEYPIYTVLDEYNVGFLQKLDIVLQDKVTKKYLIIDLKTSKKSWNDFKKKDDVIRAQLLFYKIYFSKKNNIDIDDVDVVFYILKKEVPNPDDYDFEIKVSYLQRVEVPDGKVSINKANKLLNNFLLECFSTDGKYIIEKEYDKLKGRNNFNCTYCAYNDNLYCDEKLRK